MIAICHPETRLRVTASLSGCWARTTATALARRGAAAAQGACLRAVAAVSCMAAGGAGALWVVGFGFGVSRLGLRDSQQLCSATDGGQGQRSRPEVLPAGRHGRIICG